MLLYNTLKFHAWIYKGAEQFQKFSFIIFSFIWNNIPRKDLNLRVFLEYEEELGVRGKNVKEKISEFFGIVQVFQH